MAERLSIRACSAADVPKLAEVFLRAVHETAAASYDEAQRHAWAPKDNDLEPWRARLAEQQIWLAEIGGQIAGFIGMKPQHVEMLFTHPAYARRGVASALYRHALKQVPTASRCTTDASLEARPFFERQGWRVQREEVVERNGVKLRRFHMQLAAGDE